MNYQKVLDEELKSLTECREAPRLLLHSCCAPCSSYVLEYLSQYFRITVFYYNPNIAPDAEYEKRLSEQKRLLREMPMRGQVDFLDVRYDHSEFLTVSAGLEAEPEGGKRCESCFTLRLKETAKMASALGCDYFSTTLSVSPHKDSQILNRIGGELAEQYNCKYLYSDFKKREGYKRSLELSSLYGLYRQNWCGCEFSTNGGKTFENEYS